MPHSEPSQESIGQASDSHDSWRPSPGQFIAIVALVITLVAQVVWAGISLLQNEADTRQVINQETDVSSLTFIQRESLTLRQRFDSWALGEASARDVQIARANLGQRLRVITSSNVSTADLTTVEYREALDTLDGVILELSEVPEESRIEFRQETAPTWEEFDRQARLLSLNFQTVLDQQTEQSIAERQRSQGIYVGLLGLSMGLLALVAVWVSSDIVRNYRRISEQLSREQEELRKSRERLLLMSGLEKWAARIVEAIKAKRDSGEIRRMIKELVADLLPNDQVRFVTKSDQLVLRNAQADSSVAAEDRHSVMERVDELLAQLYERDANEASRNYLASHDELTGLNNRHAYTLQLNERTAPGSSAPRNLLVVAIDVDRFGELNSAFGFDAGDDLLKTVAAKLRKLLGSDAWIARVAGDEFAIIAEASSKEAAEEFLTTVHNAMRFTMSIGGTQSKITCTTGALWAGQLQDPSADIVEKVGGVLHLAKELGDGSSLFFDPTIHRHLGADWLNDLELQRALKNEEFVLHFQPVVTLDSGYISGFEALIRWEKPGMGLVMPGQFLSSIGRAGLTLELGREIVENALKAWKRSFRTLHSDDPPYITINVDPAQLRDESFADFTLETLKKMKVPAEQIVVEVTERDVSDGEVALSQLERLRAAGARVAIDDFGTGFSSLSQLHKLPVDIVKIDRSFLESVEKDYQSFGLISDIVRLAERLGLTMIAEGIETEKMSSQLLELGVTHGQGYFFSPALPEKEAMAFSRARHSGLGPRDPGGFAAADAAKQTEPTIAEPAMEE